MKIGVDARALSTTKSGVGYYVASVLEQLAIIDQDNEYYLYSNKPFKNTFQNERFHCRISVARFNNWWVQMILPELLVKDGIDVFWGGGFILPIWNSKIKKVVTIHDFVYYRYPQTLPRSLVLHFKLGMPFYVGCADHVLVDSDNTDRDLREIYHCPSSKITVAHLAAREEFFDVLSKSNIDAVLRKYQLNPGYILFVGTVEPRKGVDTILKALSLYKKRVGQEIPFVVVGQIGWKSKEILTLVNELSLKNSARFLEYVSDDDLAAIYQGAKFFVYPSLYEGFGLPVLEAMASGVPVITSTASSLPEVAGDAALYIAPGDEQTLSVMFEKVLESPGLLTSLSEKGRIQARKFSWKKTAEETLQVFCNVKS